MSVTYAPQSNWGSQIASSATQFAQFMQSYQSQKLQEKEVESQLQTQQIQRQVLQQNLEQGSVQLQDTKAKLEEWTKTAPMRQQGAQAELEGMQARTENEKTRGKMMQDQLARNPIEHAQAGELHEMAKAKMREDMLKSGIDRQTAEKRLQFETPMLASQLMNLQQDYAASKERVASMQAERSRTSQQIEMSNMQEAMKVLDAKSQGQLSQEDFESLKKNAPPPIATYLKGFTGAETAAKTPDEMVARLMGKMSKLAESGDPDAVRAASNLYGTVMTGGRGVVDTTKDAFGQTQQVHSLGKAVDMVTDMFKTMNSSSGVRKATTQPTTQLTREQQKVDVSTGEVKPAGDHLLDRVEYHISQAGDDLVPERTFVSNKSDPAVKKFMEKIPRIENFSVDSKGRVVDEPAYNKKKANFGGVFAGGAPTLASRGDLANNPDGVPDLPLSKRPGSENAKGPDLEQQFKQLVVEDPAASIAQQARYQSSLSLIARDFQAPKKAQQTLLDVLGRLKTGTVSDEQHKSLLRFGRHLGLNIPDSML